MNTDEDQQGASAKVNGLDLYYEIHGSGQSLVLLPGGFMTIEAMGEVMPQLATARRVIGVELQGHGHTADIERPLRFELMADDIAALIRHLGLEQADLSGFSLGGGVALQTAIRHPEVVRKLALASTAFKRDGWYPEVLAGMASICVETFAGTPIHEAYLKTSPRPEAWPTFVAKMRQLLGEDYDWTEAVASLKTPTLILVGDADSLRLAHAVECFALLGGGKADGDLAGLPPAQLAVLPTTTLVGWAPVLATCDIHSKNRDKCQEHHQGTTLSYWLQESSTEKRAFELFRTLLLRCFFSEESEVMKRLSLRSGKRSFKERHGRSTCRRHLRNTGNGTGGLRLPR